MNNLIVKKSTINGMGLFAERDFQKGEIVTRWEYKKLTQIEIDNLSDLEKNYVSELENGSKVLISGLARFVNHSCNANTAAKDACDIAIRDIKRGEEITANYLSEKAMVEFECNCGSINCAARK
jgi:SET domain-containing protein